MTDQEYRERIAELEAQVTVRNAVIVDLFFEISRLDAQLAERDRDIDRLTDLLADEDDT